ncbi:protein of unknown function [Taphrina deformans PYCC 5710]|uniref:Peroxin-14 n=1 Tax=Taphrina deformans (strain PYCC 5710 / ATCC 11124 / CBS 356.35 / IMI 108563 / JCM 9778 / NBRC 8474) TaxID=1097556 RepID=R4XBH4_TAPDE|nr:protein of unknown function [Taphrina deformans PYCC 5710]|eukprot:CCG80688.1 protein of unknown function [Taphrina deformans PYCC 5710]
MLIGSTGIAMLLARVARVVNAQQEYQSHVKTQLKAFVESLAKSITALPGRQIIVDTNRHRLYVNTETQTESLDSEVKQAEEAEALNEASKLSSVSTKLRNFGQKTEEELYEDLNSKMSSLKAYVAELDASAYRSSYSGFGTTSASSTDPNGEAIQKFKAEIRSVKGTMLNARTFSSAQNRTTATR